MTKNTKLSKSAKLRSATKSEKIVRLLKRSSGTTIADLQKLTGWQTHSVRGFLSRTIRKQMKLNLDSEKTREGERRYRIIEEVDA